jgi:hypothetical protein
MEPMDNAALIALLQEAVPGAQLEAAPTADLQPAAGSSLADLARLIHERTNAVRGSPPPALNGALRDSPAVVTVRVLSRLCW